MDLHQQLVMHLVSFDPNGFTVGPGQVASSTNDTGTNNTIVLERGKQEGYRHINSDGNITSIVSANQAAGIEYCFLEWYYNMPQVIVLITAELVGTLDSDCRLHHL